MTGNEALPRRLGTADAVVLGIGSMLGAGVFSAFTPAAQAAGSGLLLGLGIAAVVAFCNATSSARLAARYPTSGGTYVYGRQRLGAFWGYLAGWSFVVGKTASCAAMALTVGHHVSPDHAVALAVGTVAAITFLNYYGVHRGALLTRVIVVGVLAVLAALAAAVVVTGKADRTNLTPSADLTLRAVLESAGFLFFAFAGYARIATLGEEVRDPERVIPRAIRIALAAVFTTYAAMAASVLGVLGAERVAATATPLVAAAVATDLPWPAPIVRPAAVVAAVGALLALILGVSRTTFAMAREGHLPGALAAVHPTYGVPHRAELAVAVAVIALVLAVDLRGAIGFSSFLVLVYYAIANASALTLERRTFRWLTPMIGLLGCVTVAAALPPRTVAAGAAVVGVVAVVWRVRHRGLDAQR